MTTPLPISPTPYITPDLLRRYPTGISWASIPPGRNATGEDRLAIQADICGTATDMVDAFCKQPLRATADSMMLYGPGVRVGAPPGRDATLILERWPVLSVVSVQVSPNRMPYVWTPVPAGYFGVKYPVSGMYGSAVPAAAGEGGQAVTVSERWINRRHGMGALAIQVDYLNGWPHCGLVSQASPVTEGTQVVEVDDCTAWALTSPLTGSAGATGTLYDSGAQEVIQVTTASAPQGPGTLTLASPLKYAHDPGVMVSTLPRTVTWAAALYCVAIALERGATSTTVQEIPGKAIAGAAGVKGPGGPAAWADKILQGTFNRII